MATWAEKASKSVPSGRARCGPKTSFLLSEAVLGPGWPPRAPQPRFWKLFHSIFNFFTCFRNLFYRLVSFLSAPAVSRGSSRKQLTAHSKLNDGCDGNALHNNVQHKYENPDGRSRHGGGEAEGQWIRRYGLVQTENRQKANGKSINFVLKLIPC